MACAAARSGSREPGLRVRGFGRPVAACDQAPWAIDDLNPAAAERQAGVRDLKSARPRARVVLSSSLTRPVNPRQQWVSSPTTITANGRPGAQSSAQTQARSHRPKRRKSRWNAGRTRSVGRIATTPEALELFASSLAPTDRVALEVTGNAGEIARILRPHVGAVVVVSPHDTGISRARAKTDRLDARALAKLLVAGELDAVWMPDEWTRAMRRRLARRSQLVRARTRAKNEIHAVLIRRLQGRPPVSDVFGVGGRQWLSGLDLPDDERETIAGCLRHIDFLDGEVAALDRAIASEALRKPEVLRLMTVPGVSAITASTFVAAIGDIGRFRSARQLVGYLGLDPRVRQSGPGPARHGRITKQGSASVRHVLVEAAWTAVRAPGPMRAFYERVRARRGAQVAAVATARKLANLFWCLLTRAGLRLRTTVAGAPQDPPPRARRRRTVTQGPGPSRSRLAQQADP
jgi:transposase